MRLEELFPLAGGLLLGCLAHVLHKWSRASKGWMILAAVVIVAVCATVASGEFRESWGFLVVDLSLVSLAAVSGYLLISMIERSHSKSRTER